MQFDFDFDLEDQILESPLVERIWRTRSDQSNTFVSTAGSNWMIVITQYQGKTTLTVRGPETKTSTALFPAGAEFLGITFKLGAYMPHLPLKALIDRQDENLPEAASNSFWLKGSAWEYPTFENANTFINRLIRQDILVNDEVVVAALQDRPLELSQRSVQRRFLQVTGTTQKMIQQIERATQATALLSNGQAAIDVAYELGYYDQSHLTNALSRFIGQTPAQVIQQKPNR